MNDDQEALFLSKTQELLNLLGVVNMDEVWPAQTLFAVMCDHINFLKEQSHNVV